MVSHQIAGRIEKCDHSKSHQQRQLMPSDSQTLLSIIYSYIYILNAYLFLENTLLHPI